MNKEQAVVLLVHVKPGSKTNEIIAWEGGMLRLRVKAPPTEGAANQECRRFLAYLFDMPLSNVRIQTGASSRIKKIRVFGISNRDMEEIRGTWFQHNKALRMTHTKTA